SMEDYLEAILELEKKNKVARVKDISAFLSVQMPSVTGALKILKTRGLINYEKNSYISLTEQGTAYASKVREKHTIITSFLRDILLLAADKADEEACKIEHVITLDTALRLQNCGKYIRDEVLADKNGRRPDWEALLRGPV
ncbi:MAG: metal-dependent transcriptional regulator, partial [Spirochaetales bacterium]